MRVIKKEARKEKKRKKQGKKRKERKKKLQLVESRPSLNTFFS